VYSEVRRGDQAETGRIEEVVGVGPVVEQHRRRRRWRRSADPALPVLAIPPGLLPVVVVVVVIARRSAPLPPSPSPLTPRESGLRRHLRARLPRHRLEGGIQVRLARVARASVVAHVLGVVPLRRAHLREGYAHEIRHRPRLVDLHPGYGRRYPEDRADGPHPPRATDVGGSVDVARGGAGTAMVAERPHDEGGDETRVDSAAERHDVRRARVHRVRRAKQESVHEFRGIAFGAEEEERRRRRRRSTAA